MKSFRKIAWTDLFIDVIKRTNCKELNTEINMEQSITVAVKDASLSLIISSNMAGSTVFN